MDVVSVIMKLVRSVSRGFSEREDGADCDLAEWPVKRLVSESVDNALYIEP